jgi:hypothetical protein
MIEEVKRDMPIELQKRDLDLLLYVNEMGSAQADVLCLKVFCESPQDFGLSRVKTAKRRIWCLEAAGLLRSFRVGREPNSFLVTRKGVQILSERLPEVLHLKPIQGIQIAVTEHNRRVHWSRLALEFSGKSLGWRSERRLKSSDLDVQKKKFEGRFQPYFPDGVFVSAQDKKVMLEYEHAEKSFKQMNEKLDQIQRLLDYFPDRYHQALVVTTTENEFRHYSKLIDCRRNFEILRFDHLLEKGGLREIF